MNSLPADAEEAVRVAEELARRGFGNEQFRRIHHFGQRASFTSFRRYCRTLATGSFDPGPPGDTNRAVLARMKIVLSHVAKSTNSRDWSSAINDAVRQYPINRKARTPHRQSPHRK